MKINRIFLLLIIVLNSCSWAPRNQIYRDYYAHLKERPPAPPFSESDYFVIFLVSARHLDYFNSQSFLMTLAKHPSDGSLNGDVGHAWVYLQGKGEFLEGGHSGELGTLEPKYFDGVMDLVESGDPNPIRYMRRTLSDGFFQQGCGGHRPTYAVKLDLTKETYDEMKDFIKHYDYSRYSLSCRQCVSFIAEIALLGGLDLESEVAMQVDQFVSLGKYRVRMWTNPKYCNLRFLSPDVLEKSLMQAVREGKCAYALDWYLENRRCFRRYENWVPTPERVKRILQFHLFDDFSCDFRQNCFEHAIGDAA